MPPARTTRRERLRAAMLAEAKEAARNQLVSGGPGAISLRAIARDVGISPSALYGYYPSLDALVSALVADLYDELTTAIEEARDAVPPSDPLTRIAEMARALRRWSIGHPHEFVLVFGGRGSGLGIPIDEESEPVASATTRLSAAFVEAFVAIGLDGTGTTKPRVTLHPGFAASVSPELAAMISEIPIDLACLVVSGWTRLYGLVIMEIFGELEWAVTDSEPLFETLLGEFLTVLRPGSGSG